jgi:uncharacterized protein YbbK (DUF523 family)/uncharacterized protein YbgA (DUF1722 family)
MWKVYARPVLVMSRCLGFTYCRYDGAIIEDSFLERLKAHVQAITICPEVDIGMGVPRKPLHIMWEDEGLQLYQAESGHYFTGAMERYAEETLSSLHGVDGFVLKSKSPSCALRDAKIMSDKEGRNLIGYGGGFFGSRVLARYAHLAVADEELLRDRDLREHFLTKLFLLARFRWVKDSGSVDELLRFHEENRLLFAIHGRQLNEKLNEIMNRREGETVPNVLKAYAVRLGELLKETPQKEKLIQVFERTLEVFSPLLSSQEKSYFRKLLEGYSEGSQGLHLLRAKMREWVERLGIDTFKHQTFFQPYPEELSFA